MPLYDDFANARALSPRAVGAIQLSKSTGTHVGLTPTLITRPADTRILTLRCESGTIRIRPGNYTKVSRDFTVFSIGDGANTIVMAAHNFETGEGPFQVTAQQAELTALTSVVIGDDDTFVRTVGDWTTDGFWITSTATLTGSSDNDGDFSIVGPINALTLNVSEDITIGEAAQTDLVMTIPAVMPGGIALLTDYWVINEGADSIQLATSRANALAGSEQDIGRNGVGRFAIGAPAGWAPAAVATLNKTDGYGSIAVAAGEQISFAAPAELTIVGFSGTDACSYWFGR